MKMFLAVGMVVCVGAAGCGGSKENKGDPAAANDLRHIGMMYHNYNDSNAKAPASADDLMKLAGDADDKKAVEGLKAGKYVMIWNVKLIDIIHSPEGTANTVLAYEKDAPTAGGQILLADMSVKYMTADEFTKTHKAKAK